jgi:hypothetical protein
MRAVQTDPRTKPEEGPKTSQRKDTKTDPRTGPRNGPKTEERSGIDTKPKDWTQERTSRNRSEPKFGPPELDRLDEDRRPSREGNRQSSTAIRGQLVFRDSNFQRTADVSP